MVRGKCFSYAEKTLEARPFNSGCWNQGETLFIYIQFLLPAALLCLFPLHFIISCFINCCNRATDKPENCSIIELENVSRKNRQRRRDRNFSIIIFIILLLMSVPWFFINDASAVYNASAEKSKNGSTILVLPQQRSNPALMIRPSGEQSYAFVGNMLTSACAVKLNGKFHIFNYETVNNQIQ